VHVTLPGMKMSLLRQWISQAHDRAFFRPRSWPEHCHRHDFRGNLGVDRRIVPSPRTPARTVRNEEDAGPRWPPGPWAARLGKGGSGKWSNT